MIGRPQRHIKPTSTQQSPAVLQMSSQWQLPVEDGPSQLSKHVSVKPTVQTSNLTLSHHPPEHSALRMKRLLRLMYAGASQNFPKTRRAIARSW